MRKMLKLTEGIDIASSQLGKYYFDYSGVLDLNWPYDEAGVRLRPYPPPLFYQYHPMAIAEYALECHRLYLDSGEKTYRTAFLDNADWFVNNQTIIADKFGLWIYDFYETMAYHVKTQFYSAMVQGYAISLLLRAYQLSNDRRYLKPAQYALESYGYYVSEMGIKTKYKGHIFYEEAPTIPTSCILNGFIFSLLGLYDFFRYNANKKAKTFFDAGIETLKHCIKFYDLGYWSRYNLQYDRFLASKYYHNIHIIQLYLLHSITGESIFFDYAKKWEGYAKNIMCIIKYYMMFYTFRYFYKFRRIKSFISRI